MAHINILGLIKTRSADMYIQSLLMICGKKEKQIAKDISDGIKAEARYTTIDDLYALWRDLKKRAEKQHL